MQRARVAAPPGAQGRHCHNARGGEAQRLPTLCLPLSVAISKTVGQATHASTVRKCDPAETITGMLPQQQQSQQHGMAASPLMGSPLALLSITALAACATFRSSTGAGLFSPALAPRAPLSTAAQQLLNGSTIFTLLASASTPGTLSVLRHMQHDLGAHRVFLLFDDTNSAWTALPAVRLTACR